jgi:hypothetical protein
VTADLGDRTQVGGVRLEIRTHGSCPFQEQPHGVFERERPEWKLLLAAHPQPCAARHDDLQAGACGDDRRERGGCIDDLLEVVDDEQKLAALDVPDEALFEITLPVEEPERPRDRADHVAGIPDRLKRHHDDAVSEVVGRCGGDRLGEAGLADPTGTGDREQADVAPLQEGRGFGDAFVAPDQRRHGRGHEITLTSARTGASPSRGRARGR